ncbi:MAG TPA: transketolase [Vicinamibacterales bacterium]|jgi:transketolase|nr:transketolase [Vicinamibacterales bacterium]
MSDRDEVCINTLRMLAVDTVQKAESGHPGMPMGAATLAYVLWTRHLRHSPTHPSWPDRDRFVLSAGHASALLYSLLHLTGYDLTLDDLKQFRQWASRTPGHPERDCAPGVEVSTGPLGQGLGNALGLAMAERWLAATFNRAGHEVVDHHTYVLASDGDMMEGISSEVASLAGTLRLGRLIVVYDANQVTLSATTDLTFTEDVGGRFEACGWHVQRIDGMNVEAVDAALQSARADDRPSLIVARTHIGYGSPKKQDTFGAHGEPLGKDEVRATKQALGWPEEPFHVPDTARTVFRSAVQRGAELEAEWQRRVQAHRAAHPDDGDAFARALAGELPERWQERLPTFTPADGDMATRDAGGKILNALAPAVTNLVGGSADLNPSTKTTLSGLGDFEGPQRPATPGGPKTQGTAGGVWGYAGRNIHFGVREHAMAAAVTGMAVHGGLIPYASTFLSFADYMRPSIRLASLSKAHVVYVWTHDSLALGEDGPTHQPIEHLASLRAIPGMLVLRPSDATETVEAWRVALSHREGPVGIVLTRQKVPVLDRAALAPAAGLAQGGYVLAEHGASPDVIVIATGSEVPLALAAHDVLAGEGIATRVVSMPSWELFDAQPRSYRDAVLPPHVRARVSVEAASPFGWERYVGRDGIIIGVDRFGASAPGAVVMREYGFTAEHIAAAAKQLLASRA